MTGTMRRARRTTAAGLLFLGAFQGALAAGAPWGAAAYGGAHPATVPGSLRATSAAAAVGYALAAWAVASDAGGTTARRRGLTTLSAVMAVGTILNLISPSPPERAWAAVCLVIAVSAWAARPPRRAPGR